ncbi:MAG: glycosyltransferase family 2 protein [Lachnospiraceae bacterium]|nr:glycosyltransferase family 2 protein [Lachnospiraceae bacterium]
MNEDIIITIAIPVYDVEKYIKRCLDSIVSQVAEFPNLIEVLLVDDGSSDGSLKICQLYKEKYNFVRIVHQNNHGLAYVRNVCIDNALGKYISFIDSDDYVLPGLYKYAINLLESYNYDVLCFKHLDVYAEKDVLLSNINVDKAKIKLFTTDEALNVLFFDNYIDVITCNKIIKKSLFEGIRYPVGKLYEDMFTTYKYISKAKLILSTDLLFYVYCHRLGSIGQSKFNEKSMDLYKSTKETYDFICNNCNYHEDADVGFVYWVIVVANMMIKANHNDKEYIEYAQNISRKFRRNIVDCRLLSGVKKIELILIGVNFHLYKLFYKLYMILLRSKMR